MKKPFVVLSLLMLSACGGVAGPIGAASDRGVATDYGIQSLPVNAKEDASFGQILNALRIRNGASPVTHDPRLDAAAQAHANDMVNRGFFAHTNPDGETEYDRIVAQGYTPKSWGENIAGRQQSEADALVAWIESPEHNRLLNAGTVDEFGFATAGSGAGRRWVLVMAREAN